MFEHSPHLDLSAEIRDAYATRVVREFHARKRRWSADREDWEPYQAAIEAMRELIAARGGRWRVGRLTYELGPRGGVGVTGPPYEVSPIGDTAGAQGGTTPRPNGAH